MHSVSCPPPSALLQSSMRPVALTTAASASLFAATVLSLSTDFVVTGEPIRPLQPTRSRNPSRSSSSSSFARGRDGEAAGSGTDPAQAQFFYSLDSQQGAYHFGYDTGPLQHQSFREERRNEDGEVHGSYGYVDSGVLRITEYTADQLGYRCRQTIRYLVEPGRGVFVPAENPLSMKSDSETQQIPDARGPWDSQNTPHEPDTALRHRSMMMGESEQAGRSDQGRQRWSKAKLQAAQPARFLGKKVSGHYKDFTSEPAVGGTAAVTSWDSAHKSELRDEEVFGTEHQGLYVKPQQAHVRPTVGGSLVWPATEDGMRVVWHPF